VITCHFCGGMIWDSVHCVAGSKRAGVKSVQRHMIWKVSSFEDNTFLTMSKNSDLPKGFGIDRFDLKLRMVAHALYGETAGSNNDWQIHARFRIRSMSFMPVRRGIFVVGDKQIVAS